MATERTEPPVRPAGHSPYRPSLLSRALVVLMGIAWPSLASAQPSPDSAPPVESAAPAPTSAVSEGAPAPSEQAAPVEIRVQGNKAEALKRASGSGTTIGEREIRNTQPESNSELLRRVPGLQVRTEDPMGLRLNLGVRGLSPARSRLILMEEDGVPVVVSPYGEPELYYTTMVERVQSVDVIKGSDVLRYGPQSVGAVVQLHTFAPTEHRSWYAGEQVGSRGYGALLGRYSDTSHDVGYVVQVLRKSGDGYRNMGFRATDAFGKAVMSGAHLGQLMVKIGFHDDLSRTTYTGLTDALYRADPRRDTIAPNDNFGVRRYEAAVVHDVHLGQETELHSALFAYQMNLTQRTQEADRQESPNVGYASVPDPFGLFLERTSALRDRVYDVAGVSVELDQRLATGPFVHRFRVGGRAIEDIARRRLSRGATPTADTGAALSDDTTHILGLSAWLEDQIVLANQVLLTPAIRYEHSSSRKTIRLEDDDSTNGVPKAVHVEASSHASGAMPGIGLVVGTPRLNAFSSAYLGYSAPRVSQAITSEGQDANLHAERSRNYELGVRGRLGAWLRAEADGFLIDFDNQLVSNNPLSGNTSEFIDGGRTRHWGAEATTSLRVGKGLKLPVDLDFGAQYTFVQARFVGGTFDGRTVPYSPEQSASFTLDAAHSSGVSAQVALSYVGAQYSDEQNSIQGGPTGLDGQLPAYTVVDAGARYRYAPSGVSFGLSVKSLLDRVYISDRLPNGIFTAGFRQIFATFAWSSDG